MRSVQVGTATLYLGDAAEALANVGVFDAVVTDPVYGVSGGKGNNRSRAKAKYVEGYFTDDAEYIASKVVPIFTAAMARAKRGAVTPGNRNIQAYPRFTDIGGFLLPSSVGLSQWGVQRYQSILYYGKDPYPQKMKHTCLTTGEHPPKLGHPCPKPTEAWKWLVDRATLPGEVVFDPFMGSGTTGVVCAALGRRFIGVEIVPEYFELAVERIRMAQAQLALTATPEPAKPCECGVPGAMGRWRGGGGPNPPTWLPCPEHAPAPSLPREEA